MKLFVTTICILVSLQFTFAQTEIGPSEKINTITTFSLPESAELSLEGAPQRELNRKVFIKVIPDKANDALVTVIKTGKIMLSASGEGTEEIQPDTLGSWKVPFFIILPTGNYTFIADKENYQSKIIKYKVGREIINDITLELKTLREISQEVQVQKELDKNVEIRIIPEEASNASVSIIRTSRRYVTQSSAKVEEIIPDTLGTWKAPISMVLSTGDYKFIVKKEGFKSISKEIGIGFESDKINFEMLRISYLKQKEKQWGTIKWISAAAAIGAGAACYFLQSRIKTYKEDYKNSINPDELRDKRKSINNYNSGLRISSGFAFTAITGFVTSWFIQRTYRTDNE